MRAENTQEAEENQGESTTMHFPRPVGSRISSGELDEDYSNIAEMEEIEAERLIRFGPIDIFVAETGQGSRVFAGGDDISRFVSAFDIECRAGEYSTMTLELTFQNDEIDIIDS